MKRGRWMVVGLLGAACVSGAVGLAVAAAMPTIEKLPLPSWPPLPPILTEPLPAAFWPVDLSRETLPAPIGASATHPPLRNARVINYEVNGPYLDPLRDSLPNVWQGEPHAPEPISDAARTPGPVEIRIVDAPRVLDDGTAGFVVQVINRSRERLIFFTFEGTLGMYLEAQRVDGRWVSIDDIGVKIGCGYSSGMVTLPASYGWTFTAPVYEGSQPTRFRFVIREWQRFAVVAADRNYRRLTREAFEAQTANDPRDVATQPGATPPIYSTPFWGSIDPGQIVKR